jgi:hypothetical protein
MTQTLHLSLPLLAAAQAQKHVTHNEALLTLDAMTQLGVLSRFAATPDAPAEGARYIVPASAAGAWAGQAGQIAHRLDGAWRFLRPAAGWLAWVADEGKLLVHTGAAWSEAGRAASVNPSPMVGVNTTADAANRLAVKANSVLFSHDDVTPGTGDMRAVFNKSSAARTTGVLFQSNWSGRAEIGLAGDDKLRVKVSGNGSNWITALTVDPSSGQTSFPSISLSNAAGTYRYFRFASGASPRWEVGVTSAPESGGDVGSNLYVNAYSDAGAYLGSPISGSRAPVAIFLPNAQFAAGTDGPRFQRPIAPTTDNAFSLGTSALRWSMVYAATGTISTSDARLKTDVEDCALGLEFIRALSPKLYRWRDGGADVVAAPATEPGARPEDVVSRRPGRRRHAGFLAQDVRAALDVAQVDCGLWVQDDPLDAQSVQSLRYEQLLAPLVQAVKQLADRLEALEPAAR